MKKSSSTSNNNNENYIENFNWKKNQTTELTKKGGRYEIR